MENRPVTGGIVAVLQFIAIISIGLAFVGGALAGVSVGAEIILMVSAAVTASLIWAASAVIQELRNIAFNTQHQPVTTSAPAAPVINNPPPPLDDAATMRAYGIEADGNGYRYGEYRYDNLRDAVDYAKKHKPASAFNGVGL